MNRVAAIVLCTLLVAACAPKPLNPPVFWDNTPTQAFLAARLHANDIRGLYYSILPTGSMEPFLTGGDFIVVDNHVPFTALLPGQVIAYKPTWSSTTVVHRIAARDSVYLVLSGDANAHYENGGLSITSSQYIGLVVAVYTQRHSPL